MPAPGSPASSASVDVPSAIPAGIGRFRVLRQLGAGAQSVVYLALDPQLQREVAIKALRGAAASSDALLNEARAVARLSHPGIVPVFEVGQALPGQAQATSEGKSGAYLVFEYVPGPTLADLMREQGALAPALAVRLLLPVLEAIEYAHACGVIHRDLKPANILMDRRGSARVMDFGIAVHSAVQDGARAPRPPFDPEAMGSTTLMGTPAYMAPEYAQDGVSTPQMDVFSAGLILYEMLVGARAAPADMGYQAVLYLMHQDVRVPEDLVPPVDAPLRAIVQRAAARDFAQRYPDMASLVQALHDWQDGLRGLPAGPQARLAPIAAPALPAAKAPAAPPVPAAPPRAVNRACRRDHHTTARRRVAGAPRAGQVAHVAGARAGPA